MTSRVLGLDLQWQNGDSRGEGGVVMRQMSAAVERMAQDFSRFGEHVFPLVVEALESEVEDQFLAQGHGPAEGAWKPLSPAYAEWKAKKYGRGLPILIRTGEMARALTKDGPHALRDYSATTLNYGTTGIPYASFHQLGTEDMPARPPFDFRANLEPVLQRAAAKAVRTILKQTKADDVFGPGPVVP